VPGDDAVELRPFFYDVADLPGHTIADLAGDGPEAQELFELFGRDLVTKTMVQTPQLSVFHESAKHSPSWRAGDEGAEWIEIHAGSPGVFTDPPANDEAG
jgi:hypothetical protein